MKTTDIVRHCEQCSENHNCIVYQGMQLTQMEACIMNSDGESLEADYYTGPEPTL